MDQVKVHFNGIDAATGDYFVRPRSSAELVGVAQGEPLEKRHLEELRWWHRRRSKARWEPVEGVDPKDLAQTGWGVIFDERAGPAVRKALGELLQHRRQQAGKLYQEYLYQPGQSKDDFLSAHGAGPGPVVPSKVPYYLLLVGDPAAMPFSFQYQLDVQYAVGRLSFDTPEEYACYARSVVRAEQQETAVPPRAAFFGVQTPADPATQLSGRELVLPLSTWLREAYPSWQTSTDVGESATKARLAALGNAHVDYGARPEHYHIVGDALLGAMAGAADSAWTTEMHADWAGALKLISARMLESASKPRT